MMGGVPRVPRHGRWGGAHPTHPVTAPWYPSSTLRNGGRDGTKRGDTFPGFGKAVSSRARLRASDRAWEAHRAGFALASTASDARAAASLAITQGDTVDGQSMTADRVEYNYTVEIPPSTAKKAPPEPMRPIREKVERWNDEVDDANDVVSVRSERERAASVISVAASMLDFDDSDGDGDDAAGRRSGYSDDSDDDLFSQAPSVRSAPRSAVPTAAAAKGGDDSDDDDWMFRGKGVKA
jgi:hypothetical protein